MKCHIKQTAYWMKLLQLTLLDHLSLNLMSIGDKSMNRGLQPTTYYFLFCFVLCFVNPYINNNMIKKLLYNYNVLNCNLLKIQFFNSQYCMRYACADHFTVFAST